MQIFLTYLFLFLFGSFIGWLIEVFFRRYFTVKKWVNPGFMKGPWLPLYGFGVVLMFTMCILIVGLCPDTLKFYNPLGGLFKKDYVSGPTVCDLIPISLMWISMVLLEFIAGLIFIKGFHIKLWDYSNIKGNILGIICPLFNLIWLAIAVIFYYGINPFLYIASNSVYTFMFGENGQLANVGFIFVIGILYGIMIYDFVTSIGLFNAISNFAKSTGIIEKYENVKAKQDEKKTEEINKFFSNRKKEKDESSGSVIKEKINELIFIDPDKKDNTSANYDEHGRPVKIDKDDNNKPYQY